MLSCSNTYSPEQYNFKFCFASCVSARVQLMLTSRMLRTTLLPVIEEGVAGCLLCHVHLVFTVFLTGCSSPCPQLLLKPSIQPSCITCKLYLAAPLSNGPVSCCHCYNKGLLGGPTPAEHEKLIQQKEDLKQQLEDMQAEVG